jgi:hypothetical protein
VKRLRLFSLSIGLLLLFYPVKTAHSQGSAGATASIEPRYIVDMPTAGLIPRGSYSIDMDFFQEGGIMVRINAGILHSVSFGISYGASQVIGTRRIDPNPLPGVNIRFRILDETIIMPAILLGFDSQGKEAYIETYDRYTIKSPGFYVAVSKNYNFLGHMSVHGGVNYSLENKDGSAGINIYSGLEKSLGPDISFLLEYNLGLNDARADAVGRGRGYLNTGVRWSFGRGFTLGFDLKDLFKNQPGRHAFGNRTMYIEYVGFF